MVSTNNVKTTVAKSWRFTDVFSAQLNEGPLEDDRDSTCCPEADRAQLRATGPRRASDSDALQQLPHTEPLQTRDSQQNVTCGFFFFVFPLACFSACQHFWNNIHIEAIRMMTMVAIKWIITGCFFPLNLHPRGVSLSSAWLTALLSMGKICFRKRIFLFERLNV